MCLTRFVEVLFAYNKIYPFYVYSSVSFDKCIQADREVSSLLKFLPPHLFIAFSSPLSPGRGWCVFFSLRFFLFQNVIYVKSYTKEFLKSEFFHLASCIWDLSMLFVCVIIPFYCWVVFLYVHSLVMDIGVESSFRQLWIKPIETFTCKILSEHTCFYFFGQMPRNGIVGSFVTMNVCLTV